MTWATGSGWLQPSAVSSHGTAQTAHALAYTCIRNQFISRGYPRCVRPACHTPSLLVGPTSHSGLSNSKHAVHGMWHAALARALEGDLPSRWPHPRAKVYRQWLAPHCSCAACCVPQWRWTTHQSLRGVPLRSSGPAARVNSDRPPTNHDQQGGDDSYS